MNLIDYFATLKRGAQAALSRELGISKTWMSQITNGRKLASPEVARAIEVATKGKVTRKDVRADIFGALK
jgi:DNA-binding transcriptional regulator YdaS (Cro superfamily)